MICTQIEFAVSDLTAISAVLIAIAALIVSVSQVVLMRRHNQMSVKPQLEIYKDLFLESPISVTIKNNGLGTAILKSIKIHTGSKVVIFKDRASLHEMMSPRKGYGTIKSYLISKNTSLAAGETIEMFSLPDSENNEEVNKAFSEHVDKFRFIIEFESIYGIRYEFNDFHR